jgi:hypothetical protein
MDATTVLLDDVALEDAVKWAGAALTGPRIEKYRTARMYYDGEQDLVFATTKFSNTFGNLFKTFAYNRCGPVVDAMVDRLQLLGFDPVLSTDPTVQVNEAEVIALKAESDRIFRLNRMDRKQNDLLQEALKCGDAYIIVWLDGVAPDGTPYPTMSVNLADTVAIRYNEDTGQKLYGVKAWKRTDGKWRVNVYHSLATYKYITPEKKDDFPKFGDLQPYEALTPEGTPELWPLPNPTGVVPVFHFNNNAPQGEFGRSELRDVIPLQDALNKSCMDMMVAMEYGAFPQRWATGLQLGMPDPVTGKIPSPFNPGSGEVWNGPSGASFGTFETANLDQFLKVQEGFDSKISNVSRVPEHWLKMGSSNLSGETLKTAEAPFVAKLEDRQTGFGNEFEDAQSYCLFLMGREGITLNAVWKAAELRSDTDKLQEGMLKKQLGWSEEQIQREFGLDQSVIDRMKEENLAKLAEAMAAAGNLGSDTGTPPPFPSGNNAEDEGE